MLDETDREPAGHDSSKSERASLADGASRLLSRHFLMGAGLGMLILLFVLLGGSSSLLQNAPAGAMYDAQAHSLLHGRWDVPPDTSGIESFGFGGKAYIYFGPFPALLRTPLLLFTDRFDGRLGQLSILAAIMLGLVASSQIVNEIIRRIPKSQSPSRPTRSLFTILGLVVAGGSVVTYIAHRGDIYNEAIAWGLGTSLASIAALLRVLRTGLTRYVAVAGAFAAAAIESRITLGVSAIAALGLVLAASFTLRTREAFGISEIVAERRLRVALSLATVLPFVLFIGIQLAKFGTVVVRPSNHLVNLAQPQFQTYLSRNGNTYFSPSFVPANLLNMTLWPSPMKFDSSFPWIRPVDTDFGPSPGSPLFLGRSWSGSLAFTQTLLFALACIGGYALCLSGLVARIAGRRMQRAPVAGVCKDLQLVVLGALVGLVGTLAYSYQYHRFLADAFPAVILLSVLGAAILPGVFGALWARRTVSAVVVCLAAWSIWVNVSTALLAQTERAWDPTPASFSRLIAIRQALGSSQHVVHFDFDQPLTAPTSIGSLADIDDCEALFAAAGTEGFAPIWWPIELGPKFKRTLQIDVASLPTGETELIASKGGETGSTVAIEVGADRAAYLLLRGAGSASRFSIDGDLIRVTLEVSPVWAALNVRFEHQTRSLPWQGHLESDAFDHLSPVVTDLGGDDVSLCEDAASGN